MPQTFDYQAVVRMLLAAAEMVDENHARLSELDSFGGDGDHGTTMLGAMRNLKNAVAASQSRRIDSLLGEVAWAVMGTPGGATAPLFGSFFMGLSNAAAGRDALDAAALAEMFEAGLESLRQQTTAEVGDKTVLDALVPAVQQARRAADEGLDVAQLLQHAAQAAEKGAESTRQLQPRAGRAKNAPRQSIGHEDPGAVSISLLFKGFMKGALSNG